MKEAEEAPQKDEERYRSLFENMLNGLAYCRMLFDNGKPVDFIYLAVNRAFEDQTGLKDVVGKKVSEVIPGIRSADPGLFEVYGRVARTGQPERFETYVESLKMWFAVSAYSPGRDHFVAVFDMITERKRAEETLRKSESDLRKAQKVANVGSWAWHIKANRLEWTDQMFRIFGLDKDGFTGDLNDVVARAIHPDDRAAVERANLSVIRDKKPMPLEYRISWPDGTVRTVWAEAGELILDNAGDPEVLTGIVHDITDRKRTEEALRESASFTRTVMDNLPVGIAVNSVDPSVDFEYMNDNFPRFYRTTREALAVPDAFWEAVYEDPEFRKTIRKRVLEDCASGDPKRMYWTNVPITRKGEGTAYISARNTPIKDKGLMISTVWDVTERRHAEDEREKLQDQLQQAMKMEAVGRLAGGVAHDFNNLLTAIIGNISMALMRLPPSEQASGLLVEAKKASERAAQLTQQLLAFSRRQIIEPKVLDLNELVLGLEAMLARLIGEHIALRTVPGVGLWRVKVDPGQIEQILVNLAVNARDAMPDGGKLLIETANADLDSDYCARHPDASPGRFVMLAVSDTGHGMSEEIMSQIFEPFFTTKPKGSGTGLGLSTIYGAVKQSGGSIEVNSEEGRGTTFRIYLPRVEGTVSKPERVNGKAELPKGSETVLLVEDEEIVRGMCVELLERLGYGVLQASNGYEAIEIAKERGDRIDLLMTDVVMPGMNGRDLAEYVVLLHPEAKVLFTSGYTDDVIVHHGVLDEGVAFIGKPYSLSELAKKIRVVLECPS